MKKLNKLFYALLVTFLSIDLYKAPSLPPPGGGTGGTNPEGAATPIDMYTFVLIAAAIVMLFIFAKKYRKQTA